MSYPKLLVLPYPYLEFVRVEAGEVILGEDENKTSIPINSFYLSKFLVTQTLYKTIMKGKNPAYFKGTNRPVERVSWNDCQQFVDKINKDSKILASLKDCLQEEVSHKMQFRLPSEAEWEYAAKGGQLSEGYEYAGSDELNQVGWYRENSGDETKPVGLLLPNELGLYDMSGNVWEWCEDYYHSFNKKGRPNDGSAWIDQPNRGPHRVLRGGSSFRAPILCRPSYRLLGVPVYRGDYVGFRLALSPS